MTSLNEPVSDYVHRLNPDGSVDSICRHCACTVAHEPDEMKLDVAEASHICTKKPTRRRKRAAKKVAAQHRR